MMSLLIRIRRSRGLSLGTSWSKPLLEMFKKPVSMTVMPIFTAESTAFNLVLCSSYIRLNWLVYKKFSFISLQLIPSRSCIQRCSTVSHAPFTLML